MSQPTHPAGSGRIGGSGFTPPRWLRNPHLQTALGSSGIRQRSGLRALEQTGAEHQVVEVDGGDGVRLRGVHSAVRGQRARGLVLLLHGWEGSAESGYMRHGAARLLAAGFEVFRLNFRDHGDTHSLNRDIFHSARLDEVVNAACDIAQRFPVRPLLAGGWSLGGNFALRLALRAPEAGLALAHVAAVCPVIDPARTMERMETGSRMYLRYFEHKWRRSLRRKRELFPDLNDFDDAVLARGMRELTGWLVEHHTRFGSIDNYFDGYSIAGDRLAALRVPASILMAADDPVIPLDAFHALSLPTDARIELSRHGGHCGFIENLRLEGFGERWLAARLAGAG